MISFNVVNTRDDTHGEPMVVTSTGTQVKVSPFGAYPAKGRATGGVRVQRFLKGEDTLLVAWVVLDYSAQRRVIGDLEERGVTRRSQRKAEP